MKLSRLMLFVAMLAAISACAADDDSVPFDGGNDAADVVDTVEEVGDPDVTEAIEDVPTEETGPEFPPLTEEEIALITSGDTSTRMDLVTNETPEGDAFLHEVSLPVDPNDPLVAHLIARMRRTLAASFGGVGIAAPQVGVHRRIFLAQRTDESGSPIRAFINPTIVEYSPETRSEGEGCLSIPGGSGNVERSLIVVVDYVRGDLVPFVGESIGSLTDTNVAYAARIVQHEYDHLEGILFIER
jgi:peptide deformylase